MRYLSTLLILLSINISLLAQSFGVNLPDGTVSNTMLDVNGSVSFREGTALTCVNGVNNNIVLDNYSFYRITGPTAAFSITGFGNGTDGRCLTLINASGQSLTLSHLISSIAANQINTSGSAVVLPINGVVTFIYNANLTKWIVSGTMGSIPSFANIFNGALSDSMVVVNNGVPLKVRPNEYVENYAWGIDGNDNITDGTHFLGTTTNVPLSIKVNNQKAGRIGIVGETYLGYQAGNGTTGINNTLIGYQAGNSLTSGANNIAIGTNAQVPTATASNQLSIGNWIYGVNSGNIGIGASLKVGSNATAIDANSVLELESTTKGFVPPRMTTAQMNAIAGALVGSVVYNTTLNCLHQRTSSGWLSMCNSTSPFTYESTQTTVLSQAFNSAFADIPGVGSLSVVVPRTAAYTITARGYFASGIYTTVTSNSGAQGSFKLVVDGTSYDESYLASAGFYNAAGNYNFYGLGAQGTIVKILTLTAGAHTISIQGRTWFGTNCTVGTWGILTSGYVNSNGADAGKCKLTVVEN